MNEDASWVVYAWACSAFLLALWQMPVPPKYAARIIEILITFTHHSGGAPSDMTIDISFATVATETMPAPMIVFDSLKKFTSVRLLPIEFKGFTKRD